MHRCRKRIALAVLGVVLAAVVVQESTRIRWMVSHYQADPLSVPATFVSIPVESPSGIVYHARRETLIAVSDKGQLVEMDDRYNVLQRIDMPGDPEGVSVHPDTGTLFVVLESSNSVVEYDLDRHRTIRTFHIDFSSQPDFAGGLTWNNGLEGVAVVTTASGDHQLFVAVEAHPARVVRLTADVSAHATAAARESITMHPTGELRQDVEIAEVFDVGLTRISDIAFDVDSGLLFVTSAGERVLTLAEPTGRVLRSVRLPGKKPEGICLLTNGDALVVDDTGGAWVLERASALFKR